MCESMSLCKSQVNHGTQAGYMKYVGVYEFCCIVASNEYMTDLSAPTAIYGLLWLLLCGKIRH